MILTKMFMDIDEMNKWLSNHIYQIVDIKFNMTLSNEHFDFRYLVIYNKED
jgi:hypothetical protein